MQFLQRHPRSLIILFLLTSLTITSCVPTADFTKDVSSTSPPAEAPSKNLPDDFAKAQSAVERETAPNVSAAMLSELTTGNSAFAFDLYQALRGEPGNLFYAPFSISTALAMTYAGARNETEAQMAQTLRFTLPQEQLHPAFNALDLRLQNRASEGDGQGEDLFKLNIVNSLWGQIDFQYQADFLDLLAEHYGAELRLVDFIGETNREEARLAINDWVSDQTEGKIEDLLPEGILTELTRLILTNAIYFKAEWEVPFLNGTRDGAFTLLNGDQVTVPMMSRRADTNYAASDRYQAIELPYKGSSVQMIVLLPEPGQFEALEASLDKALLDQVSQNLAPTDLKLFMPKFAYDSSFGLAKTLATMGMPDAFDRNRADFTGIGVNPSPRLFLKDVLHKAFVAVDEIGTEAAASTAVIVEIESMPVVVNVDRPFIFIIRDSANDTILFIGRVLDPTA